MKKMIGILSVSLLPIVSFAQNYSFKMMNGGGYGYNGHESSPVWVIFFMLLLPLIVICFFIAFFVFWIIMLIDAIKHSPEKTKVVWVLVIIFTHIVGALIYYYVEKKPRNKAKIEHTEHKKKENN